MLRFALIKIPVFSTMRKADHDRHQYILNQIRSGNEMNVCINSAQFSPETMLNSKSQFLRLCLSLHRLDLPVLTRLSYYFLRKYLPLCDSPTIASGFRCLYGNLVCDTGVGLHDTFFADYVHVYIGKDTHFSFQNMVLTSTHDFRDKRNVHASEIVIGENVWITSRVTILSGVKIGRNSVIAAGSVVSRDIPPNVLAAGNPARPVKVIKRGD